MIRRIDIRDDTAKRLAQLQILTGQNADTVIDAALRAAVKCGADQADAGDFSDRSLEDIFAQGIAQAKQTPPQHS